jgi:hypothetical protein
VEKNNTNQGCQMVYFQAKNSNLGKIWRALEWKTFGIFYGQKFYGRLAYLPNCHLVIDIVVVLYIFPRFGTLCPEKSGNPDTNTKTKVGEKKVSRSRAVTPSYFFQDIYFCF